MAKKVVRGLDPSEAATFAIKKLIIHEVPAKAAGTTGGSPNLSEYLLPLDSTLKSFFEDRVKDTMKRQAQPVEEDTGSPSKVASELKTIANAGNAEFLSVSQDVARHLFASQNKTNSDGLLVVANGTTDPGSGRQPAALVMKLETSEGANITRQKQNGKVALAPQHIQDLMLSDKTRVFKAAVVRDDGSGLIGIVSDHQTELGAENFRGQFLGLMLSRSPAIVTRAFSEAVDEWITTNVTDDEQIVKYRTALRIELGNNSKQLSPQNFIATYIDDGDRQLLETHLNQRDVPLAAFEKNVGQLKPRHLKPTFTTKQGIRISGNLDVMQELVEPFTMPDGESVTLIYDTIKS